MSAKLQYFAVKRLRVLETVTEVDIVSSWTAIGKFLRNMEIANNSLPQMWYKKQSNLLSKEEKNSGKKLL